MPHEQPRGQGTHDLSGQVAAGLGPLRGPRDIAGGQREAAGEPSGGLAGRGQAKSTDPAEHPSGVLAEPDPPVTGELPSGFQVGQVVQERLDVGAAELGGPPAMVVAGGVQVRRQPGHRSNDVPEPCVQALPPVPGQLIGGPPLDRFPQPVLGDAGEGQPPR